MWLVFIVPYETLSRKEEEERKGALLTPEEGSSPIIYNH